MQRRQAGRVFVQRCLEARHSSQEPTFRFSTPAARKMSSADFCNSLREINSFSRSYLGQGTPRRKQLRQSGRDLSHRTWQEIC